MLVSANEWGGGHLGFFYAVASSCSEQDIGPIVDLILTFAENVTVDKISASGDTEQREDVTADASRTPAKKRDRLARWKKAVSDVYERARITSLVWVTDRALWDIDHCKSSAKCPNASISSPILRMKLRCNGVCCVIYTTASDWRLFGKALASINVPAMLPHLHCRTMLTLYE